MTKQHPVTVKSGNVYYCQPAGELGIDVCSEQFAEFGQSRDGLQRNVKINGVEYFVRGTWKMDRRGIDLYMTREITRDATDAARKKAHHEIAEAAGIYVQQHGDHLAARLAEQLEADADRCKAHADRLSGEAEDKLAEASSYYSKAAHWRALATKAA